MIFLDLFLTFFKIGAFTFGGGYAMLPLIQSEMLRKEWISSNDLIDFIAVSESTPGPLAVNLSTYIGSQLGKSFDLQFSGLFGSFCATLGVVLPSFIIILIVAKSYERFKNSSIVKGCMSGLRPAVIGLIASAVLSVAGTVFFPNQFILSELSPEKLIPSLVIFALCLLLVFKKTHPILIILSSAAMGIAAGLVGL